MIVIDVLSLKLRNMHGGTILHSTTKIREINLR
jgi:hypothetical protein